MFARRRCFACYEGLRVIWNASGETCVGERGAKGSWRRLVSLLCCAAIYAEPFLD